jgi:hypothetical protein
MLSAAKHLVLRPFAALRVTHKCANLVWFDLDSLPYDGQPRHPGVSAPRSAPRLMQLLLVLLLQADRVRLRQI